MTAKFTESNILATTKFQVFIILQILLFGINYVDSGGRENHPGDFLSRDPEAEMDLEELINHNGYASEVHDVVTEDGFVLGVHRIPYRFNGVYEPDESEKEKIRPTVLLVHGATQSAFDFLAIGNQSLGYVLCDIGYDVWILNYRATKESSRHNKYTVNDWEYWDWSSHEIALYDIPATIDYILDLKKQTSLFYIGYSNGNPIFFSSMALNPEYNDKIRLMLAMGPTVYQHDFPNGLDFVAPALEKILTLRYKVGDHMLQPERLFRYPKFYSPLICSNSITAKIFCQTFAGMLLGFDYSLIDSRNFGRLVMPRLFNPISTKFMLHWVQLITSRRFQQFDHGETTNLAVYGTKLPPEYDLTQVRCPVGIFWANNDFAAHPKAIKRLAEKLPNVVYNYPVAYSKFNHLDFVYGDRARVLVYDDMLELMQTF